MLATLLKTPSICVGIPTYLREQVLLETLEYVFAQSDQPEEIIVADQTLEHSVEVAEYLQRLVEKGQIRRLTGGEPSLTKARNAILRESRCEYVLFIDDDVVLPQDFVCRFRRALRHRPAALGGGVVAFNCEDLAGDYRLLKSLPELFAFYRGGNEAVLRQAAIENGGFDERFVGPAHGEEQDFAYRLLRHGFTVAFDPQLSLQHLAAPTGGCRVAGNAAWEDWHKPMNLLLLVLRYPRVLDSWWWRRIWAAFRCGPLLKENISFGGQVRAWRAFARAVREAVRRRKYA